MKKLYLCISAALCMSGWPADGHTAYMPSADNRDTLELPFFDDFSYPGQSPDAGLWQNSGASISCTLPLNPPSTGALTLDALDSLGRFYSNARYGSITPADTIESRPINLQYPGNKSIYLSYFYQRGGLGDPPETGDSLILEFYSPTERQWSRIKAYEGGRCQPFRQEMIQISENKYLQKGFRFRFRNYISLGSQLAPDLVSNCDHWMIDYVTINRNRTDSDTIYSDVALSAYPEVRIGEYQLVPWRHYTAADPKPPVNYMIKYRNNDSKARLLDSINLYLSHDGKTEKYALGTYNMPGSMDFDNENPDLGYTLTSQNDTSAEYNIEVRLVSDALSSDYPANNSLSINKKLTNCYAYDDGTPEAAYGLQGEGSSGGLVAVKFRTLKPDILKGIYMYFCPIYGNRQADNLNLKIWDCENGLPKNAIYTKRNVSVPKDNTGQYILIPIDEDVEVADTFFVGWEKNDNAMIAIGFDKNSTAANPKFYNIGGKWKQSKEPGQIMLRPAFGQLMTPAGDIRPGDIASQLKTITVYPNPASQYIRIKGYQDHGNLYIISASGKPVMQITEPCGDTEIDISGLARGTYIIYQPDTRASAKFIKAN